MSVVPVPSRHYISDESHKDREKYTRMFPDRLVLSALETKVQIISVYFNHLAQFQNNTLNIMIIYI
jgi:hypothetical protein